MPVKCPVCGRFMVLVTFEDEGRSPWESFMWWNCPEGEYHDTVPAPVPAPEYQWEWECEGIPFEALRDWPELLKEYIELWNRLPRKLKRLYRSSDPAKI